jgi:hypothetical protein
MTTEVVIEAIDSIGTRIEVANLFGVSEQAVGQWVNEKFPPSRILDLYNFCGKRYDLEELLAR